MATSIPTSVKAGPFTTNLLIKKRYLLLYLALIWLSLLPVINSTASYLLLLNNDPLFILVIAPIIIIIQYFMFLFGSMFWSWLFYRIVFKLHHPKEGIFPRTADNADYRYWTLRALIKKYAIWVAHNFPFPWVDLIVFNIFGNRVGWKVALYDSWIDMEFVSIGEGTMIGQGAVIQTALITHDQLIIQKTHIGKNCVIGAHAVISPGTIIDDDVVLGALSMTSLNQHLETNWLYFGRPAEKVHRLDDVNVK